jgi:hypothetical protein
MRRVLAVFAMLAIVFSTSQVVGLERIPSKRHAVSGEVVRADEAVPEGERQPHNQRDFGFPCRRSRSGHLQGMLFLNSSRAATTCRQDRLWCRRQCRISFDAGSILSGAERSPVGTEKS